MATGDEEFRGTARYRPLSLMRNPFVPGDWGEPSAIPSEVGCEANRLLAEILRPQNEGGSRPLWVIEPEGIDDSFFMDAISKVEYVLANDRDINALHGYVPLPAMRIGAVRAILGVLAERLVFRDFEETLQRYVAQVLAEPHSDLAAYQLLGPERLAAFAGEFNADPERATLELFGPAVLERQTDLADSLDMRQIDAENLGDDADADAEVDSSIGLAPGVDARGASEEADEPREGDREKTAADADSLPLVLDYVIEYTKVHESPVLARALRVYRERGQIAAAAEFKVTKAPRKTVAALVRLARQRFDSVVILLAEFEYWTDIPEELRHKIVGALSELRWSLGDSARLVFLATPGQAPELEESFGSSAKLEWTFENLRDPDRLMGPLDASVVDRWLACAAVPGGSPMKLNGTPLASIADQSDEDFESFIRRAHAAVEDAAQRSVDRIDAQAIAAAAAVDVADTAPEADAAGW